MASAACSFVARDGNAGDEVSRLMKITNVVCSPEHISPGVPPRAGEAASDQRSNAHFNLRSLELAEQYRCHGRDARARWRLAGCPFCSHFLVSRVRPAVWALRGACSLPRAKYGRSCHGCGDADGARPALLTFIHLPVIYPSTFTLHAGSRPGSFSLTKSSFPSPPPRTGNGSFPSTLLACSALYGGAARPCARVSMCGKIPSPV